MTLLIACILIYGFKLHWGWYVVSTIIWTVTFITRIRLLNMQDEYHTELIQKITNQSININELPSWFDEKTIKQWKKHLKNLH